MCVCVCDQRRGGGDAIVSKRVRHISFGHPGENYKIGQDHARDASSTPKGHANNHAHRGLVPTIVLPMTMPRVYTLARSDLFIRNRTAVTSTAETAARDPA